MTTTVAVFRGVGRAAEGSLVDRELTGHPTAVTRSLSASIDGVKVLGTFTGVGTRLTSNGFSSVIQWTSSLVIQSLTMEIYI